MITFLTVTYVIVCLFLVLVVLLQAGKGGGMGAAFGGATQSVFGGAGAGNFLTRLTVISAMLFMMLSATLAYLSSSSEKSLERASEAVRSDGKGGDERPADAPSEKSEKAPTSVLGEKRDDGKKTAPTLTPIGPPLDKAKPKQGGKSPEQTGAALKPALPKPAAPEPKAPESAAAASDKPETGRTPENR
jgi:preprotein translocase subunit SecG